jgi:signal transduction histidine kinase
MSATAIRSTSGRRREIPTDPPNARIYLWAFGVATMLVLVYLAVTQWNNVVAAGPELIAWGLVIALADSLPVRFWGQISLSMSLPVTLAVGILFTPVAAAILTFGASIDPREVRGEISPSRALYNRSQISLSVLLASTTFHALGGAAEDWPDVLWPAVAALVVDFIVNTSLVTVAASLISQTSPHQVLRRVLEDSPAQYLFGYAVLGLLALVVATVGTSAGVWGGIVFLAPLALARMTFVQAVRLEESTAKLQAKNRALLEAIDRVAEERRDERMVVAGELHDEVLPPLFKVHLMGQVLKQDLTAGRLLDLDDDLPELLSATQTAQSAIRSLVGDLRRSAIGTGGLNATLELLAQQLETAGSPRIELHLDDVGGSRVTQLLVYQVAREAMTNASKYSRASRISVRLWVQEGLIRLLVEDDGVGFNPRSVNKHEHFGLQLIEERVEAARGTVVVDSMLGGGTRVVATLPPEI